jgi:IMP dehydrogenase
MTSENLVTTSRSTDLEAAADILQQHKIEKLPVVDKDINLSDFLPIKI